MLQREPPNLAFAALPSTATVRGRLCGQGVNSPRLPERRLSALRDEQAPYIGRRYDRNTYAAVKSQLFAKAANRYQYRSGAHQRGKSNQFCR